MLRCKMILSCLMIKSVQRDRSESHPYFLCDGILPCVGVCPPRCDERLCCVPTVSSIRARHRRIASSPCPEHEGPPLHLSPPPGNRGSWFRLFSVERTVAPYISYTVPLLSHLYQLSLLSLSLLYRRAPNLSTPDNLTGTAKPPHQYEKRAHESPCILSVRRTLRWIHGATR